MENMQFCKEVDRFKTLPDNKLEKEAKAIAAKYIGEDTPKAVSNTFNLSFTSTNCTCISASCPHIAWHR